MLSRRGVLPGTRILDAGCGTGRYATELGRRGYIVRGIDLSPDLVAEAKKSLAGQSIDVSFAVGDILVPSEKTEYDAVLCRGVLNDLVDPNDRQVAFLRFAWVLRTNGVLLLDVREWNATAVRKARQAVFEKSLITSRGALTFRSVARLDSQNRQLIVSERHTLKADGHKTTADYEFVMKCWIQEELRDYLTRSGFRSVQFSGGYDSSVPVGATDRLVAVASRVADAAP